MGIFDFFKKKSETSYDITDIRITDLASGFVFDYDLSSWEVIEEYTYDWGNHNFSKEFKITNGDSTKFLSVDQDDEVKIILSEKLPIRSILSNLPELISQSERPPHQLDFEGESYLLDKEAPGFFHEEGDDEEAWEEFNSWDYNSRVSNKILCLEQWDDFNFEASKGIQIKEYEISNILPSA